jgi:HPt (histidine-containing phosphotransfer) domain-containing protein
MTAPHHDDFLQTDAQFFGDLINQFATRLSDDRCELQKLRDALTQPGIDVAVIETIRFQGHRLAGTSAALGFRHLAQRARDVEAACRITLGSYRPDASLALIECALGTLLETIAGRA